MSSEGSRGTFSPRLERACLQFISFVSASIIALSFGHAGFVEELPPGCLELEDGACAVRTSNALGAATKVGHKLDLPSAVVVLDHDTVVVRSNEGIRLVQGAVWVRPKKSFAVQTEFGVVSSAKSQFWVTRDALRMTVRSTGSDVVEVRPRGASASIGVEPGFENWIAKVGRSGMARVGLPTAIDFKDHLLRWGRLYEGSKKQFKTEAEEFHGIWLKASNSSSELHQKLYERKIASVEETKARQVRERQVRQARDRELTELFRRKVFEE